MEETKKWVSIAKREADEIKGKCASLSLWKNIASKRDEITEKRTFKASAWEEQRWITQEKQAMF